MHLNDNSLFCVFTNLDVMCSPNRRLITETMVSFLFRLIVQQFGIATFHLPSVLRYFVLSYSSRLCRNIDGLAPSSSWFAWYDRYIDESSATTLAGNPASKILFTDSKGIKIMQIWTIKGYKIYHIIYPIADFISLPVLQRMIDSFQITKQQ